MKICKNANRCAAVKKFKCSKIRKSFFKENFNVEVNYRKAVFSRKLAFELEVKLARLSKGRLFE